MKQPWPLPNSVQADDLQGNNRAVLFQEQNNYELQERLKIDITQPGTYTSVNQLQNGFLESGTPINSYFLHFDPVGSGPNNPNRTVNSSITFDEKILGVIVTGNTKFHGPNGSGSGSNQLGLSSTSYRGEGGKLDIDDPSSPDFVQWNGNTISFNFRAGSKSDQIRIITEHPVPPALTRFDFTGVNVVNAVDEGTSVNVQANLEATDPNMDPLLFILQANGQVVTQRDNDVSGTRSAQIGLPQNLFRDDNTINVRVQVEEDDSLRSPIESKTIHVRNVGNFSKSAVRCRA